MNQLRCVSALLAVVAGLIGAPDANAIGPTEPMAPGLGGYVAISVMASESANHLLVDDRARLDQRETSPRSNGETIALPLFETRYTFANRSTQLYAGVPVANLLSLRFLGELGIRQRVGSATTLQLALYPRVADTEVWADPYQLGAARTETDQQSEGLALGLDTPALAITIGAARSEVADERSGGGEAALRRDADYLAAELRTALPLADGVTLLPSVHWLSTDALGEAISGDRWLARLGLAFPFDGGRQLVLSLGAGRRDYAGPNPLFAQTQEDELLDAALFYLHPLAAWPGRPALTLNLIHESADANIDFLDRSHSRLITGIAWRF